MFNIAEKAKIEAQGIAMSQHQSGKRSRSFSKLQGSHKDKRNPVQDALSVPRQDLSPLVTWSSLQ